MPKRKRKDQPPIVVNIVNNAVPPDPPSEEEDEETASDESEEVPDRDPERWRRPHLDIEPHWRMIGISTWHPAVGPDTDTPDESRGHNHG